MRRAVARAVIAAVLLASVGIQGSASWHHYRRRSPAPARRYAFHFRHYRDYRHYHGSRGGFSHWNFRSRRGQFRRLFPSFRSGALHHWGHPMSRHHLAAEIVAAAGQQYRVDPALLSALSQVESGGAGFMPDGRPKILFERHILWRALRLRGVNPMKLASAHPDLCGPHWEPGRFPYGSPEAQYRKLEIIEKFAAHSDPDHQGSYVKASWEACSWGLFQILGIHWQAAGFVSPNDFVKAMQDSEEMQLEVVLRWMDRSGTLQLLRNHQWVSFVRAYNGQGQVGWYTQRFLGEYRNAAGYWCAHKQVQSGSALERLKKLRLHFFGGKD